MSKYPLKELFPNFTRWKVKVILAKYNVEISGLRLFPQFNSDHHLESSAMHPTINMPSFNFNHFPNELKTLIFSYLERPIRGKIGVLGKAALVCKEWRQLAENPDFWGEFVVGGEAKKIVSLLNSFRCSRVRCVELGNREHLDKKELADIFNALRSHSKSNYLETLLMSGTRDSLDLSAVHPFKLAEVVENLDSLIIENCQFTEDQLNTLFLHLAELPTRLGRLSFPGADLKSVPADLLARAVAGLQSLVLPRADLTQEQVLAIFNTLDGPDFVRCQWVDLKNTDLSVLEPSLMAKVVARLKVAELYQCSLTRW